MSGADRPPEGGHGPPRGPAPVTVTVTVLSGNAGVMELVTAVLGPGVEVHLQQWSAGGQPRSVDEVVGEVAADDTMVLCIGDDVPLDLAFAVASTIDRYLAHVSVLLLAAPWPEVWRDALRSGVRDVVDPREGEPGLRPALQRAFERAAHMHDLRAAAAAAPAGPSTGRVVVVLSPKGGSGKTMVAANLTAALARHTPGPVALVDLDVQFGDSASAFGLMPEHTLGQLALVPDIDSTTLKVFLTPHEASGAFVLCGSASPDEGEAVTDKHAGRIAELLMRDFAFVVIDTPAGLDERTLAVLERATDVVLVSTMDVSSIRNLGKEIVALDRVGMVGAGRHFVLNRADARVGIEIADVEAALGMTVDASVPSSRLVPLSMNQGRPLVIDDPASPPARELLGLAQRLAGAGVGAGGAVPGPEAASASANGDGRHGRGEPTSWFRRKVR